MNDEYQHVKKITEHGYGGYIRASIRSFVPSMELLEHNVYGMKVVVIIGPAHPRIVESYEHNQRTGRHVEVGHLWITEKCPCELEHVELKIATKVLTGEA